MTNNSEAYKRLSSSLKGCAELYKSESGGSSDNALRLILLRLAESIDAGAHDVVTLRTAFDMIRFVEMEHSGR